MADYLPLFIENIKETNVDGEIRISAETRTIQPESIRLNLSKLDAARLQTFQQSKGKILMVPIRRGEVSGRPFTSIADGYIIPADNIQTTFDMHVNKPQNEQPAEPKAESKEVKPLFGNKAA